MADSTWLIPIGVIAAALIGGAYDLDRPKARRREIKDLQDLYRDTEDESLRIAIEELIQDRTRRLVTEAPRTRRWAIISALLTLVLVGLSVASFFVERAQNRDSSHLIAASNGLAIASDRSQKTTSDALELGVKILPGLQTATAAQRAAAVKALAAIQASSNAAIAEEQREAKTAQRSQSAFNTASSWAAGLLRASIVAALLAIGSVAMYSYLLVSETQPRWKAMMRARREELGVHLKDLERYQTELATVEAQIKAAQSKASKLRTEAGPQGGAPPGAS